MIATQMLIREVRQSVCPPPTSIDRTRCSRIKGRRPCDGKPPLVETLRQGAKAAGFPTGLWALRRVAQVMERELGVRYHPGQGWYVLQAMGWNPRKLKRRARELDEEEVKRSWENEWPIVFIDESGYMLQPLVRRTWVPKGETPIPQGWSRRSRWLVIAGIGFSPVQRCHRLFFHSFRAGVGPI